MNALIKEMTNDYIIFNVTSETRDLTHELIFNRNTREWSCSCEDFTYRKRMCKHTRVCKQLLNSLIFECSSNIIYAGETLTGNMISAKAESY